MKQKPFLMQSKIICNFRSRPTGRRRSASGWRVEKMSSIDVWNTSSLETCQQICECLGWPLQYAEGEASLEWLTPEQYAELEAYPEAGESYEEMCERVWPETVEI